MESWQKILLTLFSLVNLLVFIKAFNECKYKNNSYGKTKPLWVLGIFVWGDALIFTPFWILVSTIALVLHDWVLFLLIISVFWVVRSLGETVYWFNQQFSKINRNPPEKLMFYSIVKNDSVWFIYQIMWQCVTVISVIFTIYFSHLWLLIK